MRNSSGTEPSALRSCESVLARWMLPTLAAAQGESKVFSALVTKNEQGHELIEYGVAIRAVPLSANCCIHFVTLWRKNTSCIHCYSAENGLG